jgi:hypothetical protein
MWKVGLGLAITAIVLGGAAHARAEEPAPPPAATPASVATPPPAPVTTATAPAVTVPLVPAPAPCPPVIDVAAEQRAFNREMELFRRRWEVTQRLVAEREARAFEEAEARYAKLAALTKKLAEDAAAEAERQFDAAVTLFVKKRELTRTLSVAPKAAPAVAPETPTR